MWSRTFSIGLRRSTMSTRGKSNADANRASWQRSSVVDASGWIKVMPHAHNGYLDVRLETGRIGFALFVSFIITTLYAIARMADFNHVPAWIALSLALFVIFNFLEKPYGCA